MARVRRGSRAARVGLICPGQDFYRGGKDLGSTQDCVSAHGNSRLQQSKTVKV
ncbi:hypothetical protein [Frog virus 3]